MIARRWHSHENEYCLNMQMEMINHFTWKVNISSHSYIDMRLKETNDSWTNEKPLLLEWTLMSLKTRRKLKLTLQNTPSSWHQIHLWSTDRLVNLLWAIQVMTPCKSYVLEWRQRSNCKIMIHPWKITDVCVRSGIRNTLISIILMFEIYINTDVTNMTRY